MADMEYPLSVILASQTPTYRQQLARMRADAIYLGKVDKGVSDNDALGDAQAAPLGDLLQRYIQNVRLEYLATNKVRVPYDAARPPVLVVNGFMLVAGANVDLASAPTGGSGQRYVMANRTADSTTFTITVQSSAVEGVDQRLIGEFTWDGANIDQNSIQSYELQGFGLQSGDEPIIKGWAQIDAAGNISSSYNVSSAVRNGVGDFTVNWDADFSGATKYACVASVAVANGAYCACGVAAASVNVRVRTDAGANADFAFGVMAIGERA